MTAHRIINGQPFAIAPALEAVYDCTDRYVVVRKAAQVGISEWLLNNALWVPDTRQGGRGNSLYVFPAKEQGEDFSKARIDKAIDESPYLAERTAMRNVGLKKIGYGHLYVRGAQNRRQMISVDADCALFDEVAEYTAGTVDTMVRRLGSSALGWIRAGSTPRYPSDEAAQLWDQSTQSEYHVRCSHCGTQQPLTIADNLDPDTARVLCTHCHGDMTADRLRRGIWVDGRPGAPWRGFQMNKLLYPLCDLVALAEKYRAVLDGRATATQVQEFHNSDAGLPHIAEGGSVTADMLDACIAPDYLMPYAATNACMGVDVGNRLHIRINVPEDDGRRRAVYVGSVRSFDELDPLMARYDVGRCVIDANPETRKVLEFAERWPGRVWPAYYPNFADTQHSELCVWDRERHVVKINRTAALDKVMARVAGRGLILPHDARQLGAAVDKSGLGEYYRHMGASVRVVEDDARGNPVARYDQNGPDHFGHAEVYAEIAAHQAGDLPFGWLRRDPDFRAATLGTSTEVVTATGQVKTFSWLDDPSQQMPDTAPPQHETTEQRIARRRREAGL